MSSSADIRTGFLPTPEIVILGNGQVITSGDNTAQIADGTDFSGMVVTDGAITHAFTIYNIGTADLTLTGIPPVSISGSAAADFTVVTNPGTSLAPNEMTAFQIRFDPTTVGTRSATVTIMNNDVDENPYTFAISGEGTTSIVQFSQAAPYHVDEGVGTSTAVTLSHSGDLSYTSTVQVTPIGGSAVGGGVDYDSIDFPLTITFTPDTTSRNVPVLIIDDTFKEPVEEIILQLTGIDNTPLGPVTTATLKIIDNDDLGGDSDLMLYLPLINR
jgi:hypothetical protein